MREWDWGLVWLSVIQRIMGVDGDGLGNTCLKWCGAADKARRVKLGIVSPQSCFPAFLGKSNQSCSPAITRQFLLSLWGCCIQSMSLLLQSPLKAQISAPVPANKILPILLTQESCNACKMSLVFSRIEQYFYHLLLLFSSSAFLFTEFFYLWIPLSQGTPSGTLCCVQLLLKSTSTCHKLLWWQQWNVQGLCLFIQHFLF